MGTSWGECETILPGDIFLVRDELIDFPEDELKIYEREHKGQRPVIVLQCKDDCENKYPRSILIAPLSTAIKVKHKHDMPIAKGDGKLKYDSVIRLGAIQPILKDHLRMRNGPIEPETYAMLKKTLMANFGVIPRP